MEASYFYALVLPLGIFVFLMSSLAFYYAKKEEIARKKWMELTRAEAEMAPEPEEMVDKELNGLEKLLQNKSIDHATYEQLRKVLEDVRKMNTELDCSEKDAAHIIT
jgi:hypothetical protein